MSTSEKRNVRFEGLNGRFECADKATADRYLPALIALEARLLKRVHAAGSSGIERAHVHAAYDEHGLGVYEVDFTFGVPGKIGSGGSAFMNCEPDAFALLYACEKYVRNFGVKPFRPPGWESEIDDFAEAEEALDKVLKAITSPAQRSPAG